MFNNHIFSLDHNIPEFYSNISTEFVDKTSTEFIEKYKDLKQYIMKYCNDRIRVLDNILRDNNSSKFKDDHIRSNDYLYQVMFEISGLMTISDEFKTSYIDYIDIITEKSIAKCLNSCFLKKEYDEHIADGNKYDLVPQDEWFKRFDAFFKTTPNTYNDVFNLLKIISSYVLSKKILEYIDR